ncbi:MAG: helix-turn-helix domain-containing protein [Candidatus Hydrogenedentota bacterium]
MKWDALVDEQCSVARTSAVLGDRWTLVILTECFLGVNTFEAFRSRLDISRTTLTNRLQQLQEHGILVQVPYQEKPTRNKYKLTEKGRELYPVIVTLADWGDKYYSDDAGPPILRKHTKCGHDFHAVLGCAECGEEIDLRQVTARKRPENSQYPPVLRGPVG